MLKDRFVSFFVKSFRLIATNLIDCFIEFFNDVKTVKDVESSPFSSALSFTANESPRHQLRGEGALGKLRMLGISGDGG